MKKILFVCNNMDLGGIQKSLINLLKHISSEYEVSLLLFSDTGYYMSQIPSNIKLLKSNKFLKLLGSSQQQIKEESFLLNLLRGGLVIYSKIINNKLPRKFIFSTYPEVKGFDIAISFSQDINDKSLSVGCNEFVLKKIDCSKKISFVHSDFKNYGGNSKRSREIYSKFDKIACVSHGCRDAFESEIPHISSKTSVVNNCHDINEIINNSKIDTKHYDKEFFNIITVARLTEEKGILRSLQAIKTVVKKGFKVKWHIVGDGNQRQEIENQIKLNGLENTVILYGSDINPYKYISNADLFLLPSFHEAAPIVFGEAQVLRIPILTTETISAKELVEKNQAGIVCENSLKGITDTLIDILSNKNILNDIRNALELNFNNENALKQFKSLIEK